MLCFRAAARNTWSDCRSVKISSAALEQEFLACNSTSGVFPCRLRLRSLNSIDCGLINLPSNPCLWRDQLFGSMSMTFAAKNWRDSWSPCDTMLPTAAGPACGSARWTVCKCMYVMMHQVMMLRLSLAGGVDRVEQLCCKNFLF